MKDIIVNESWEDDFLYGTKVYHTLMQRYCDYFKKNFKSCINQFGYFRHDQDGHFVSVSNWLEHEELYLEHKGYKDDPHHTDFRRMKSGLSFDWPNRHIENIKHNTFRLAIYEKFGTYGSVCAVKKTNKYYYAFWWGFASSIDNYKKDQLIIIRDFLSNALSVKKCLTQCKEELFPLLERKVGRRVNFKALKGSYYQEQEPIIRSWSREEKDKIVKFLLVNRFFDSQEFQKNFSEKEKEWLNYFIQTGDVTEVANITKSNPMTIKSCLNKAMNCLVVEKRNLMGLLKDSKKLFGL